MRLSAQLIVLVLLLVVLLFSGFTYISLQNARVYLSGQLASHAQDAATSLGLSATSHLMAGDAAAVHSLADALFDGGDYLEVAIYDTEEKPWVVRNTELRILDVPAWFVSAVPLDTPLREATLMSGWSQAGVVQVRSHPGYAYEQLWATTRESLVWFVLSALIVLLVGLLLLRYLLRPLKQVEWQAESICNREFPVLSHRPFTLEFRRVVEAMNMLSGKVRQMLADSERLTLRLREQAYQDPLTGLANRRQFDDLLAHRVADDERAEGSGLILLALKDFKAYNQAYGFPAGDELLIACAEQLRDLAESVQPAWPARIGGAEFGLLVEGVDGAQLEGIAQRLAQGLSGLYGRLDLPSADVGHVGAARYQGQTDSDWFAEADMALRQAQGAGPNAWQLSQTEGEGARSASEWRHYVDSAIADGQLRLQKQPVIAVDGERLLHHEVFARLPDPDRPGEMLPAARFVPMVEGTDFAVRLDKAVVSAVLSLISRDGGGRVAVNMSPASLLEPAMLDWMIEQLGTRPREASKLILEFSEYGATAGVERLRAWIDALSLLDVEFSIDHFGQGFSSFGYLSSIKAHYLKVHGSFVRDLGNNLDNQFFLQSLTDIAHGLSMAVVAESVETEDVWQALAPLGVDGGQGYWLGVPLEADGDDQQM